MLPQPRLDPELAPVPGARWIALTKGFFALVDETDFEQVNKYSWSAVKDAENNIYARGRIGTKVVRLLARLNFPKDTP